MNGLPRVVTIAWCLTDASARGPARRLSHAAITAAAIEVADDQGLGAVTMARVAQRLGFTTMALYRYVSTKAELLLLMADAAVALPDLKVERVEGASGLRRWADAVRDAHRAHPWLAEVPRASTSAMMPNSARMTDLALRALDGLPLTAPEKLATVLALSGLAAFYADVERSMAAEPTEAIDPDALAPFVGALAASCPDVAALTAAGEFVNTTGADDSWVEQQHAFSVAALLAGLPSAAE